MKRKKQQITVDETIMQELLDQPGIRENVARMTPETLDWYKRLLVERGIYSRYVEERQDNKAGA